MYEFENPQSDCGARAWIESYCEPMPQDGCTFQEIMDKNPQPVHPKTKSRKSRKKASGKGFSKKSYPVAA